MTHASDVDVSRQIEPVMLELGKAVLICQAFEGTLVLLLALLSHEDAGGADGAFAASFDLHSQKTLGQLLKRLTERLELPEEVRRLLELGWSRRNLIVHRFLHDNVALFAEPKGRIESEKKLIEYKMDVKRADVLACGLLDAAYAKYGVTVAAFKRKADCFWDHMNRDENEVTAKH